MDSIVILTDSSIQFTTPTFPGRNLVKILPFDIQYGQTIFPSGRNLKAGELAASASQSLNPRLVSPPPEQILQYLTQDENGQSYDYILGIFLSSSMSTLVNDVLEVAPLVIGRTHIQVIDSQTTSIGLGILVQAAAEAISKGTAMAEVERHIRNLIPHIYTVICLPALSYLHYAGFVDRAQAAVGEMLGLYPIFAIEEGRLTPLEKARNHRQVLDFYQEYLEEFEQLQHIAFVQSAMGSNPQNGRALRDHAQAHFPRTPFSEHTINLPAAILFGPSASALFVAEQVGARKKT